MSKVENQTLRVTSVPDATDRPQANDEPSLRYQPDSYQRADRSGAIDSAAPMNAMETFLATLQDTYGWTAEQAQGAWDWVCERASTLWDSTVGKLISLAVAAKIEYFLAEQAKQDAVREQKLKEQETEEDKRHQAALLQAQQLKAKLSAERLQAARLKDISDQESLGRIETARAQAKASNVLVA